MIGLRMRQSPDVGHDPLQPPTKTHGRHEVDAGQRRGTTNDPLCMDAHVDGETAGISIARVIGNDENLAAVLQHRRYALDQITDTSHVVLAEFHEALVERTGDRLPNFSRVFEEAHRLDA